MAMRVATAWPSTKVIEWMRGRLQEAGGDPADIRDEDYCFWRVPEVERRTGLHRSTIYRLAAQGRFPRPVPICGTRAERGVAA